LQAWWKDCLEGKNERRDISIALYDDTGNEVNNWDCTECFSTQWKVNGFDGKVNDVLTEEVTFVVEDFHMPSR
jgi:phage tail-like protein